MHRSTPDLSVVFRRALLAALTGLAPIASGCSSAVDPNGDARTSDTGPVRDASADAVVTYDGGPVADAGECAPVQGPGDICQTTVSWACNAPVADGETPSPARCAELCPTNASMSSPPGNCYASHPAGGAPGAVTLSCVWCAIGRRPAGLLADEPAAETTAVLGSFLAQHATLEAVSVTAFEQLRDELRAYDAPAALLEALAVAASEERDHAERVTHAAASRGGVAMPARIAPSAPRSLEEIARDNAVEGCVRETFGALAAHWQASHAGDLELAALYTHLAADETRHAALSWELARWLDQHLDDSARARVAAARQHAVDELYAGIARPIAPALATAVGLPDASATRVLLDSLTRDLWRAPLAA